MSRVSLRACARLLAPRRAALALVLLVLLLPRGPGARAAEEPRAASAAPPVQCPEGTGTGAGAPGGEPAAPRIASVRLTGRVLRVDGAEQLLRFLDIRPGAAWDAQLQSRVLRDLEVLGYQSDANIDERGVLVLSVEPWRMVRRIFVRGNWPIPNSEITSNLSWRPRDRLPADGGLLTGALRKQEHDVAEHLRRSGYYDAQVEIALEWPPQQPELVDVRVQVHLNTGFWRLRYPVGPVQAYGFHLLSKEQVRGYFEHCCLWFGRTSSDKINDDFKKLLDYYHAAGYASARLVTHEFHPDRQHKRVDITVAIDERKRIEVVFSGNRSLSVKELKEAVTIYQANYYSSNELDESARQLFRLYQKHGFFEARVSWRWRNRDSDPVVVEFLIHEGPELRVREVSFAAFPPEGGRGLSFDPAKLRDVVQTKRYPRLGIIGLGEGGYATAIQLEQDLRRLEAFYRSRGYLEAHAWVEVARDPAALDDVALLGLQTAIDPDEDSGDLHVRFRIEEGTPHRVARVDVAWKGAHTMPEASLRKVLRLLPGRPYTPLDMEADKQRVYHLFRSAGHPYPKLDLVHEGKPDVNIRWEILDEGPLVTFGPILVRGNFLTRESVLRKHLPFRTGDPFDENKLREAEQNLLSRELFDFVRVTPNPGETPVYAREAREACWTLERNPVPVLVEVGERYDNRGEIQLFVGASTDNLLFGSASYIWRNLFGTGIEMELRGEVGFRLQSMLFRLSDPRIFGPFWVGDLRGFWRNQITPRLGPITTYGGNLELTRYVASVDQEGRRLRPTLRFYTRLDFTISQILVPLWRTEGTGDNFQNVSDQTQAFKLSVGFLWDRRVGFDAPAFIRRGLPPPPDPLMPVSGFLLAGQVTGALCCSYAPFDPFGSFLAVAAQAMWLRPFGPELKQEDGWPEGMRRFSFKSNLQFNYGYPFARSALPVVERFYAGGDTATRGYYTDELKAEIVRSPVAPLGSEAAFRIVPQGGNIRILSVLEWEFAITPRILGWPWVGALFLDTGAVFNSFAGLTWNDVRFSVGVSLFRLLTRFGALSFEYAYPLTMPGQDPLVQSERWKSDPSWLTHWPGRFHFNWGIPIGR